MSLYPAINFYTKFLLVLMRILIFLKNDYDTIKVFSEFVFSSVVRYVCIQVEKSTFGHIYGPYVFIHLEIFE